MHLRWAGCSLAFLLSASPLPASPLPRPPVGRFSSPSFPPLPWLHSLPSATCR